MQPQAQPTAPGSELWAGIRHLLLDFGGVLYSISYEATSRAFEELGHRAGVRPAEYTQARQEPIFDQIETGQIAPDAFRQALRRRAQAAGLDIALLSNTNAIHWEQIEGEFAELRPYFAKVFLSHEVGLRKPNADIFEHVLREMKWQPGETLFVDDSRQHIETAQRLGLRTLWLTEPALLDAAMAHLPA